MLKAPKGYIAEDDPKVSQVGHPAPPWMSSYADLMTELVCFFVILYALSAALNKNVQSAAQQVKDMIDKKEVAGSVKIDKDGLKITIEEQGKASFFASGSAETTPEIDGVILKLAPTLRKLAQDHDILVEGHTDSQRLAGEITKYYDSNWELSGARATSVARLLVEKYGLPPNHIGAVGYGEYRPIATNDTPEGRAMNRRVVFFVKNVPAGTLAAPLPAQVKADEPPTVASSAQPKPAAPAAAPSAAAMPGMTQPQPAAAPAPEQAEPTDAAPGQTGAAP
jgi:chemotaxis protein MotB